MVGFREVKLRSSVFGAQKFWGRHCCSFFRGALICFREEEKCSVDAYQPSDKRKLTMPGEGGGVFHCCEIRPKCKNVHTEIKGPSFFISFQFGALTDIVLLQHPPSEKNKLFHVFLLCPVNSRSLTRPVKPIHIRHKGMASSPQCPKSLSFIPVLAPPSQSVSHFSQTALCFIHIPKTAGTSIEALLEHSPKHINRLPLLTGWLVMFLKWFLQFFAIPFVVQYFLPLAEQLSIVKVRERIVLSPLHCAYPT